MDIYRNIFSALIFFLSINSANAGTIFANTGTGSLMQFDMGTLLQTEGASITSVSAGQDLTFDDTVRLFGQFYDGNNNLVEYDPTTLSIINQTSLSGGRTSGLAAWDSKLFALTGTGSLMQFDMSTLLQTGGASITSVSAGQDLTFDNTGRLFGQFYDGNNNIVEYDPTTLSIINQTSLSDGRTSGLAAWDSKLFALTGTGSLMQFDMDTLLQTGGASITSVSAGQDLTFDNTGRLFGQFYDGNNSIVEYDPTTLSIINQTSLSGGRTSGLEAITAVPEPAAIWLFASGIIGLASLSRLKKLKEVAHLV